MASAHNMGVDSIFRSNGVSAVDVHSPSGSGFFHDDAAFDTSRTETSVTGANSLFATDTSEWVSAQANAAGLPMHSMPASEALYAHAHDALSIDSWTILPGPQPESLPLDAPWLVGTSMAPNMAPSISEFTQWADTLSSRSSPITAASMGEIEGSCSPELTVPPLTIASPAYESLNGRVTLSDFQDPWGSPHGFIQMESIKPPLATVTPHASHVSRPSLDQAGRNQSNESDPQRARSDPRYRLGPKADGQYYCPFPDCLHAPDKLKCNYDKHLDSHLKPYRCKVKACQDTSFSSTACVLRHEREAHGMHGHGNKPFTCIYRDCERHNPENGFPRRWNLHDHMRRMHGHVTKSGSSEESEPRPVGVTKVKRNRPAASRSRISKDDTIKASSRKTHRSSIPKGWLEEQAMCPSPTVYDVSYHSMDVSQASSASIYAPWSAMP